MSGLALTLLLLAQVLLVASQILLKHGMNQTNRPDQSKRPTNIYVASGIGLMTLWFFLWTGLLQRLELSRVFPFEGISPALLVVTACIVLREKVTLRVWMGVGLISAGTALVGLS